MLCAEYIWNYFFYQDGTIEFEIRLTGILQVYVSNPEEPSPFGTFVAPHINAHYHQHLFSLRVDPMVDGLHNSVVESSIIPLPNAPTGSKENYAGNAFVVKERTIAHAREGARDYDFDEDRRWRIVNTRVGKHYASGRAPGYVIGMKGAATRLLAREDGWAARRAAFAKKALWVVKDVEVGEGTEGEVGGTTRMWPAGKYVPQTREEPEQSVGRWVQNDSGSLEDEDIVLFLTLGGFHLIVLSRVSRTDFLFAGTTHIPRPEDWPV
jgi:primary-amine oxidase